MHNIWNKHEDKEERVFPLVENKNIIILVKKMQFEHRELKKHKEAMIDAINSGSEIKIKEALNKNGRIIIEKLRNHIKDEDEVLYRIVLRDFKEEELQKMFALL